MTTPDNDDAVDGKEGTGAAKVDASAGKPGRERLATILLLVVAVVALVGVLWSSRSRTDQANADQPKRARHTRSKKHAARLASSASPVDAAVVPAGPDAASLLAAACPSVAAPTCDCRFKALERSFSLASEVLTAELLKGTTAASDCAAAPTFLGLKAEALARAQSGEAQRAIDEALAKDPNDAHAAFASGLRALLAGDLKTAAKQLDRAEQLGRGAAVATMKGILALRQHETKAAESAFERGILADPEDVDAMYNLGAIEMAQGVYNKPRALFLKVLKLRPDYLDARFALASLTFRAGALPEAKRHQALLEATAPTGDERVLNLRELMKSAPPASSQNPGASAPLEVRMKSPPSRTP